MSTRGLLEEQVGGLPHAWQRQVDGFVRFRRLRDAAEHWTGLLLGESALARNSLTPDAAAASASL
jgi:hypothetical protein